MADSNRRQDGGHVGENQELDVMRSICYTSCHIRLIIYNCSIVIGCVRVMVNKLNFISNRVVSRVVGVR